MKILIADDDPVSCRLLQRMLERSGYDVIVAADGRAALLELSKPDGARLALIDWMMPEIDGPSVCREIRRRPDSTYFYIVLLTSRQTHADIVEGLEAGADDYLTKPCHPSELKARLLTGRRILDLQEKLIEARDGMRLRATEDGLTRLLNRTAILNALRESLNLSRENGMVFSILLCDIDLFRSINDGHGHLAGDTILEHFASRLQKAVRSDDSIGRYGGEEFLIILNGCDVEELAVRAELIRQAVCGTPFAIPQVTLAVSVSIGGTTANEFNIPASAESMIDQAEVALYQAKAHGRNCVRIAAHRTPPADATNSEPVAAALDSAIALLAAMPQA